MLKHCYKILFVYFNTYTFESSCIFKYISDVPSVPRHPCAPSPCGPNSICKVTNDQAVCTCQAEFIGAPPSCRPECLVSSECNQQQACIRKKCVNPCEGVCGQNTDCKVINHSPICTCRSSYTGDPFSRCYIGMFKVSVWSFILRFFVDAYF